MIRWLHVKFLRLKDIPFYYFITLITLIFAFIDTFYKHVSWVSVALLCIGCLPWVVQYVSELELPGGWKLSTRDQSKLGSDAAQIVQTEPVPQSTEETFNVLKDNPDIALAGLRIEFERKLVLIARLHGKGVSERAFSITVLTRHLRDVGVLRSPEVDVLLNLIPILNDAVHARKIDADTRNLVLNSAKPILAYLDVRIGELHAIAAVRGDDA